LIVAILAVATEILRLLLVPKVNFLPLIVGQVGAMRFFRTGPRCSRSMVFLQLKLNSQQADGDPVEIAEEGQGGNY
jgi:hypothetical protein